MVAEAVRALQSDYSAELMDMFILTHQRDETLRQYVFRTCANPRDRTARYTHLHRARRRFVSTRWPPSSAVRPREA